MPGQQHCPMYGTYGMWATSGPSCSAKETPVWSSPLSSGSAHSPLRAHHEGLVLCVLVHFLQAQKRPFSHAQVLLYWFCPSDAAVPVELGLSSSLATGLVLVKSCPEVPSSSFPPETFLLLTTWFQLLWRPCSCLMPGRARRGILNPERRGRPQPRLGMVVGNQDPSCAI